MTTFASLGLRAELLNALKDMGFTEPTPVQVQAIPLLLGSEKDVVVLAQTGTGKTAAFGLPLLQAMAPEQKVIQALVLAPTRELCVQIAGDFERFSKDLSGTKVVAVYGGASIRDQIRDIQRGANIIVATPGRLLDMLGRKAVDLSQVNTVVLDEADEMLNMGFQEDLTDILLTTPKEKRTWLFSATMSRDVRRIAKGYMRAFDELNIGRANAAADAIQHQYAVVHSKDRYAALKRFIDADPGLFAIVFCRTKRETQELATALVKDGYNADALHGDLSQAQRDHVMGRYRARSLQLLIATDVAARGIDVDDVTHVIHFDLPRDPESYTHRSGRTARAGRTGISLSVVGVRDRNKIQQLENRLKTHFTYVRVPGGEDIGNAQLMAYLHRLKSVEVDPEALASLLPIAYEELSAFTKEELIEHVMSLAFNRIIGQFRNTPDLNIDLSRKDHTVRSRPSSHERFSTGRQMFINLGTADGFDKGRMLGYICGVSGISGELIGRMLIKDVYSFIDIEPNHFEQVFHAFRGADYKGRKIRVDEAQGQGGPGRTPRPSTEGRRPSGDPGRSNDGRQPRTRDDRPPYKAKKKGGKGKGPFGKKKGPFVPQRHKKKKK